jgi:diguanylate cyclase (GGDEF)-like protein
MPLVLARLGITARWAPVGLGVVLLVLAGFAVGAALFTGRSSDAATRATETSASFEDARFAVSEVESLERFYLLEPSGGTRAAQLAAFGDMATALRSAARSGTPREQAVVQDVLARQDHFLDIQRRLFAAKDAGDEDLVETIDEDEADPAFDTMEAQVGGAADTSRAEAAQALRRLEHARTVVLVGTPIVFVIGALLLGLFTWVLVDAVRRNRDQAAANRHQALHDALTGLPNRIVFHDRLGQALRHAEREREPLAVMIVDLDRFKEINDTLGHANGDELLRLVGPRLQAVLRARDTIARLSGDEFAVLLPGTGAVGSLKVAQALHEALETPFALERVSVASDASVGIALYPEHGADAETLLQRADVAMYMAKEERSGHAFYAPERDPYDPNRLALVSELRRAISDDELVLHYQPKIDLRTDEVSGVEALVRWNHPIRGLLPPMEFVPLAEHTGLMRPLTLWVLERALSQCRAWREEGIELRVAVNLAVLSLLDVQLGEDVARLLAKHEVPAHLLELEITESSVMTDPKRAIAKLEELSAMGVRLAIDDFGTGYSSLSYLRRLPVDQLKIDRSFVMKMEASSDDAVIVRSTIDLCRNLGLAVVAEGVETEHTFAQLRELGCDEAQGFLISRPVPADALTAWLADRTVQAPVARSEGLMSRADRHLPDD